MVQFLRKHFENFGVPEDFTSDGGPEFAAHETQTFLKRWGVVQKLTSAYYPRANTRAELGVKSMKRLLRENTASSRSLNCDKFSRAILEYRNTPCRDLGVSPSMILFGRNLKDHLPSTTENLKVRKEWRFDREMREQALAVKFAEIERSLSGGARDLPSLEVGDMVQIQNQRGNTPRRWSKSGKIIEKLDFDQYLVKVDGGGRITRRNRRFLKKIISTLADKEFVEGGETIDQDECRRSTRLAEKYKKTVGREKFNK